MDPLPQERHGDPRPQRATDVELLAGQRPGDDPHLELVHLDALHPHDARRVEQQGCRLSSAKASSPTRRRMSLTRLTSTLTGTGTSTTARAQPRERLVTCTI